MNKPVYLGFSILDLSNTVTYEFGENTKLCYMDRPLPKRKNKKVIGLMKNKLSGQLMKKLVRLRAKTYSYLKYNSDEDK